MLCPSWSCIHRTARARPVVLRAARRCVCYRAGGDGAQGAAQAVISDNLGHAQDAGGHAITAQSAYMGVTTVASRIDRLLACHRYRFDRRFGLIHLVSLQICLQPAPSLHLRRFVMGQLRKIG